MTFNLVQELISLFTFKRVKQNLFFISLIISNLIRQMKIIQLNSRNIHHFNQYFRLIPFFYNSASYLIYYSFTILQTS